MSLNGSSIANNSFINVDDIGEGDNALLRCTNKIDCCGEPMANRAGEWYYPNGASVGIMGGSTDEFYRNRGPQVVRLHHRQGTPIERGLFRCEVPDASNTIQPIHA